VPSGNPTLNPAITVDPHVHARADGGDSALTWITEAVRRAVFVRYDLAAVAEWKHDHEALTADEMTSARQRMAAELTASRT
jgi:hypothetical protein